MDQILIDEMKLKLEEEKSLVEKELQAISDADVGDHVPGERAAKFPNYGDDAIDEASESPTEVVDYTVNVSVTGTLEEKAKDIEKALVRITDGSYGTCIVCNKEITKERLEANPAADKCIGCAKQ